MSTIVLGCVDDARVEQEADQLLIAATIFLFLFLFDMTAQR